MSTDYQKYLISRATEKVMLKLSDGGELEVTIRKMPWSVKNRIVSESASYDNATGNTVFNGDRYLREALKFMIVQAPWGATTDVFLAQVGDVLGKALEELVPVAFGGSSEASLSETKKDTKVSSEVVEELKSQPNS